MKIRTEATMKIFETLTAFMVTTALTTSVFAADEGRKLIDASADPVSKAIVQITQPNGLSKGAGNGFIIGSDACHVLTNFHVAFAKDMGADGEIVMVDNQDIGHVVEVGVDFNSKTGLFRRRVKARVIEFGNFERGTSQGMRGDLAMLKLDDCLGKEYGVLKIETPEPGQVAPKGALTIFSFSQVSSSQTALYAETGCGAAQVTPIAGLFTSTCVLLPGMSGSPVLKKDSSGQYIVVGINTGRLTVKGGPKVGYALHSSTIAKFVSSVIGSEPIQIGIASTPSTNDTVTAQGSSGRTVVR